MKEDYGGFITRIVKGDGRITLVFRSVFVFSILAHLYRYANSAFNSDSLGIYRGGADVLKQIGRGRWMQPIYLYLRGTISAPYLLGILATLYLAISIVLMIRILEITNRKTIIILSGLLSVSPTITITNAAYVPWIDMFMLSLLFGMISAYCLTVASVKGRYLIAVTSLVLSLALYQAYIDACMLVCLLWLLKKCITVEKNRDLIKPATFMILIFIISLIVYYGSFKVCGLLSEESSHSYNSVASATVLTGRFDLPALIKGAYRNVFKYIIKPETFHGTIAGYIHIILVLIAGTLLFMTAMRKDAGKIVLTLALTMLCPLAAYFIYLLFGSDDSLLNFPLGILYLGIGMLFELAPQNIGKQLVKALSGSALLLASVLIFFGIVYSNQFYVKKHVEEKETLSLMTRVLYRMEETEGYVPGKTGIALIGALPDSDAVVKKPGYSSLKGRTSEMETSIMYYNNYRMYLTNIMGYPINLLDMDKAEEIGRKQVVMDMPAFPYPGCTMMLEDILVVKLSDIE